MSAWDGIARFVLLPELKLIHHWNPSRFRTHYKSEKESEFEVCPKCATPSRCTQQSQRGKSRPQLDHNFSQANFL